MSIETVHLIGRIIFGGYFLYSGWGHFRNLSGMAGYAASRGVPAPKLAVAGSGLLLLIGGAGMLFNMYVGYALLALLVFLVPVTFTMHAFWNDQDPMARMGNRVNFFKNLGLIGAVLLLM